MKQKASNQYPQPPKFKTYITKLFLQDRDRSCYKQKNDLCRMFLDLRDNICSWKNLTYKAGVCAFVCVYVGGGAGMANAIYKTSKE